jgi:hypothetical protein
MKRKGNSVTTPYLSAEDLSNRWQCHAVTARRRCEKLGVKALRLSKRSLLYSLEDIIRLEADCQ